MTGKIAIPMCVAAIAVLILRLPKDAGAIGRPIVSWTPWPNSGA